MADSLPSMGRVLTAQVRYQATLITRTPRAFIFGLIAPAALLALQGHKHSGTALDATVAGYIVFGILNLAYLTYAAGLVVAREDGVLRRWRASPLPPWAYFTGRIAASVLLADAAALVLILVGAGLSGLHLTGGAVGCLLITTTLGALAVAAAGTAITPLLPPGQGAYSLLAVTYIPLLIFSNGFGSVNGLPHWLNQLMSYFPVQPVVDAASRAVGQSALMPGRDLLVLACWTAGCLLISLRTFRWDPTRPAHAKRPTASTPVISA
jgi:ABC-2 type transport system permease protein